MQKDNSRHYINTNINYKRDHVICDNKFHLISLSFKNRKQNVILSRNVQIKNKQNVRLIWSELCFYFILQVIRLSHYSLLVFLYIKKKGSNGASLCLLGCLFCLHGAPDGWGLPHRGVFALLLLRLAAGSQTARILRVLDVRCKLSLFKFLPWEWSVKHNLSLRRRRRCCCWRRLFSTPVRASALNQLVRVRSRGSEAASMQLLYLRICLIFMLHPYVHLWFGTCMCIWTRLCTWFYTCIKLCLCFKGRNVPTQRKITSQQQETTEIEQERRIYLIGWELLVQKKKEKNEKDEEGEMRGKESS